MGLAASQARFLGLTARKSNVEFQGQQINQARTALSNEINKLYNKYSELDVPVPPSKTDYTKTTYKVDSADENYSVSNFEKITDVSSPYYGYYNLQLEYQEQIAQVYSNTKGTTIHAKSAGSGDYDYLDFVVGANTYTYEEDENGEPKETNTITRIDTKAEDFDPSKYTGLENIIEYNKDKGFESRYYYMYVDKDSSISNYTTGTDLDEIDWQKEEATTTYSGSYTFQYQGSKSETKQRKAIGSIDQASSGRLNSISIISCEDDPTLVGNTYSITTTSEEDENAYEEAMNQYNYDNEVYKQKVAELNAETEKIQAEDRSLELKLDQIDTEQRALSTEMDSVKDIIKKTIESVFKTYDS